MARRAIGLEAQRRGRRGTEGQGARGANGVLRLSRGGRRAPDSQSRIQDRRRAGMDRRHLDDVEPERGRREGVDPRRASAGPRARRRGPHPHAALSRSARRGRGGRRRRVRARGVAVRGAVRSRRRGGSRRGPAAGVLRLSRAGGPGLVSNPGSLKGYVPGWEGDDFEELVGSDEEFRQWVRNGISDRMAANPVARRILGSQAIRMPAFGDRAAPSDIDSLLAYVNWVRKNPRRTTAAQRPGG